MLKNLIKSASNAVGAGIESAVGVSPPTPTSTRPKADPASSLTPRLRKDGAIARTQGASGSLKRYKANG